MLPSCGLLPELLCRLASSCDGGRGAPAAKAAAAAAAPAPPPKPPNDPCAAAATGLISPPAGPMGLPPPDAAASAAARLAADAWIAAPPGPMTGEDTAPPPDRKDPPLPRTWGEPVALCRRA